MIDLSLLNEFESQHSVLAKNVALLEEELKRLLISPDFKIHSIQSRLKTRESLARKLARPDKTYSSLWEVTDLIGLRVITYFEDSILKIAQLIERRFNVDFPNSTNKLVFSNHENFGYRSLHYICFLEGSTERRFEIQIRTVLQDAWAEVEHDLGYKASEVAPRHLRRRFSRISSLLEFADEEFVSIRNDLKRYIDTVAQSQLKEDSGVVVDLVSLGQLVQDPLVRDCDHEIARTLGKEVSEEPFYPNYLLRLLELSALSQVQKVKKGLLLEKPQILNSVIPYFEASKRIWDRDVSNLDSVPSGYSLFFLSWVVLMRSESLGINRINRAAQVLSELDYRGDLKKATEVASKLVEAFGTI